MSNIILIVIAIFIWVKLFGEESGCDKYASKYSCKYVEEKADYDVYYWLKVQDDNPLDEKYIGSTKGLLNCKNIAINYSNIVHERWNERSYICVLKKDGLNMEKHRY
jgi:hypothetical protein